MAEESEEEGASQSLAVMPARARELPGRYAYAREIRGYALTLLERGLLPRRAAREIVVTRGVSRRTALRAVAYALAELQRDQAAEPADAKRARIVAKAHELMDRAANRKRTWERDGETVQIDDPDMRTELGALQFIAHLEGVVPKT